MPIPTFFLVGAPKAGTSSLFEYLAQHPEVAVSRVKEPCYFAPGVPVDADTRPYRASWPAYLSLFAHATTERAIGEGSVAYMSSAEAPAAIAARIPDARILMVLRDPADRLFAHYVAARASGETRAYRAWVDDQLTRESTRLPMWGPVWAGRYATHLVTWRAHLPDAQMHLVDFDDLISNPHAALAGIFAFLGVDPTVRVDVSRRHNETTVARWPALAPVRRPIAAVLRRTMPVAMVDQLRALTRERPALVPEADDRQFGIDLYRDEIAALSVLTGRDYARWLGPSSEAG